ncbi:metal ABC transporter substrate-binding protein [Microvirga lotononidis]|uniref:ABC-type metal ion transport system, periplasmic component/surface adhesin n=1 Tax=Microvirga lotononidis TaxID=864069 RepID=I4YTK2_9HYPH|nr:metal ABC transporter substrate-binding protein [Microvirga lotononidis]EIM27294.1 ABC-type metal ion transport system, periplasmic component/surface adhesin [Microvirga lotononidis]WQO28533.1 metal ABC transporter substrate-binding protein [Microvirga lotononidis]
MLTRRAAVSLLAGCLTLAASSLPAAAQNAEKLKVVATFSILGDMVRNVGGERVEVTTLVGPNGDAHVYSPTPADGRRLSEAKVVFTNGLKFEGWIDRLVKSSGTKAVKVEAAKGIKVLSSEDDGHDHGHDHGGADPHAWQSIGNAKIYVANIRDALISADAASRAAYEANAAAYLARLDELDAEVKGLVAKIPPERRKLITSHDAFRYFEAAYGIDFVSPQGVSTESEASARDVARIIQQIKREKITAVFVENISDARLMERIAKETGARIGDRVYSDALSDENGPAATYIDMMRHNIRAFSAALSS